MGVRGRMREGVVVGFQGVGVVAGCDGGGEGGRAFEGEGVGGGGGVEGVDEGEEMGGIGGCEGGGYDGVDLVEEGGQGCWGHALGGRSGVGFMEAWVGVGVQVRGCERLERWRLD